MAFTLRMTFSGLCLFVPEPTAAPGTGRMHVLLPGMGGHGHHGPDRHVPVLSYDAGYLVPGGPSLGVPALALLEGGVMTVAAGDAASLAICSQVVNLGEVTGRGVDPDHLGPDNRKKLTSRITLGAGAMTRVSPGACWEWRPGEFRPIANMAEWEIPNMPGDSVTFSLQALSGGGPARELGTLHARDGRVNVQVFHEPQQELPPSPAPVDHATMPKPGDPAAHFTAYYGLFGAPVPVVLPRYWGPVSEAPQMAGGCPAIPPDQGVSVFTCIIGRADL
ncbi:MAG TPA: hypothetical protein VF665_21500 [Longimicrobium sp.]|jgi:hypothetical protein|uniref:hypothetical protein n=1 Tax=Longimicrobium sp. TaxID=2029185 RepID=UPI002ED865FC